MKIEILGTQLLLLPEKAIYVEQLQSLFVADLHLGKSETFQARGIPISHAVNQATVDRLLQLCQQFQPQNLYILGDFVHSKASLTHEVFHCWTNFLHDAQAQVTLILGNHDRALATTLTGWGLNCHTESAHVGNLHLSHEPQPLPQTLNLCGHIHPCIKLQSRLDRVRLPCFYLDRRQNLLILPSFGDFTGGYDLPLKRDTIAYGVADGQIIELRGSRFS